MKKTVCALCVILLLTVLFSGCSAARSPGSAAAQRPSAPIGSPTAPANSSSVPADSTEPAENSTDPADSSEPSESTQDPAAGDGMYLLVNGTRISLGTDFAGVGEAIGEKTAPDQELGGCDGSFFGTIHSYPGMTVTENADGVISGIELNSFFGDAGDAALLGRIGLGTTMDEAMAILGEPDNSATAEADGMLIYQTDGQEIYLYFFDADSKDTVSGISMTLP